MSPVDGNHGAGDVARVLGAEKDDHVGHVLRVAQAAQHGALAGDPEAVATDAVMSGRQRTAMLNAARYLRATRERGGDTTEAFGRAFRRHTGATPSEYRRDSVLRKGPLMATRSSTTMRRLAYGASFGVLVAAMSTAAYAQETTGTLTGAASTSNPYSITGDTSYSLGAGDVNLDNLDSVERILKFVGTPP